ncbi:6-pyruvoyl trahydropterin synthase family protein [Solwaraspora sp. WMMB335]|uniref:6-pyruvoyl trahydropterin synthase family protein n=1 Tax=Solwaraspora sp. WMMB335 TaxID=3404118 RepID=UPI003B927EE0
MYRIGKAFTFEAGHWLTGLPDGHRCARQHGHSYIVEVVLASPTLTDPGFVVDFGELAPLKDHLDQAFDHRVLNDVVPVVPTSENLARVVFEWCAAKLTLPHDAVVESVRIRETAATWAEYRPVPVGRRHS